MSRERAGRGAGWHVDAGLAARFAAGTAAESDAWSLEKHVEVCGTCAALVSSAVRTAPKTGPLLAGVRAAVLERVAAEGLPERAAEGRRAVGSPAYAGGPEGPAYADAAAAVNPTAHLNTTASPGTAASPSAGAGSEAAVGVAAGATHSTAAGTTGVSPRLSPVARILWAAGPALRGAWAVALAVVALGAVALSYGAGLGASVRLLLLVTAPVLPLAGVALSYGRHADPLYEVVTATPSGGLRLLLVRAAAVLGVSVPSLTLAGAVLPPAAGGPGAAAWLLPGLALTLAALVLGSFVGSRRGAAAAGGAWALFVVAPAADGPAGAALMAGAAPYFSGPAVQSGWAAGALVCGLLLAARRRSFDHLETP